MTIYHANHPMKELQNIAKSIQLICEISLPVHQSINDIKKTNQLWSLAIKVMQYSNTNLGLQSLIVFFEIPKFHTIWSKNNYAISVAMELVAHGTKATTIEN